MTVLQWLVRAWKRVNTTTKRRRVREGRRLTGMPLRDDEAELLTESRVSSLGIYGRLFPGNIAEVLTACGRGGAGFRPASDRTRNLESVIDAEQQRGQRGEQYAVVTAEESFPLHFGDDLECEI